MTEKKFKAHPSKKKKDVVKVLKEKIAKYEVIGSLDLSNLPSGSLQAMRKSLKGDAEILMAKKRLIRLAIEESNKDKIKEFLPKIEGMSALIFSNKNPFSLYKTLEKSKSNAPIKPGQVAPKDIWVKAGPTGFAPGPIISELSGAGIPAGIEGGKVAIKKDALVLKKGMPCPPNLASVLARLKIEPMEIGLNMVGAYEKGLVYDKEIMAIDDKQFIENIQTAHRWAINLAVDAVIMTDVTTEMFIQKAYHESKALSISQNILTDETAGEILAKAEKEMLSVKTQLNL